MLTEPAIPVHAWTLDSGSGFLKYIGITTLSHPQWRETFVVAIVGDPDTDLAPQDQDRRFRGEGSFRERNGVVYRLLTEDEVYAWADDERHAAARRAGMVEALDSDELIADLLGVPIDEPADVNVLPPEDEAPPWCGGVVHE